MTYPFDPDYDPSNKPADSVQIDNIGVTETYLTLEEVRILYDLLAYQYISYENIPAIVLMKKMRLLLE